MTRWSASLFLSDLGAAGAGAGAGYGLQGFGEALEMIGFALCLPI